MPNCSLPVELKKDPKNLVKQLEELLTINETADEYVSVCFGYCGAVLEHDSPSASILITPLQ